MTDPLQPPEQVATPDEEPDDDANYWSQVAADEPIKKGRYGSRTQRSPKDSHKKGRS